MASKNFRCVEAMMLALLAGCATSPAPDPELESARQAYEAARQNSVVVRLAPVELARARDALARAEQVWAQRRQALEAQHLAHLAVEQAAIAEQAAAGREAEERIARVSQERERLLAEARARSAEQRAAQLQRALDAALATPSRQTDRGVVITLSNVLFDFAGTSLRPGGKETVAKLAGVLHRYPDYQVLVEGHTDSIGSEARNLALSERRADTVRRALIAQHIDPGRIASRGYGEQKPIADNRHIAGRQLNRRVEVLIFRGEALLPVK